MSDRLREALSHIDAGHVTLTSTAHLWALNEIYAAARRFLALTETGPDYEAALRVTHRHGGPELSENYVRAIIDAALADYLTEEET